MEFCLVVQGEPYEVCIHDKDLKVIVNCVELHEDLWQIVKWIANIEYFQILRSRLCPECFWGYTLTLFRVEATK